MTWCKVGAALVGCAGLVLLAAAVLRLRQLGLPRLWFTPDGTLFEAPAPVRERMEFFVEHNRVCMLGALAGLGTLYLWLSSVPLRRGEAWAWWAVLLSVVAAGASLLTVSSASAPGYRLCGALATALALTGLAASGPAALRSATARALMRPRARAWRWSPAGLGRLWLTVWCLGGVLGGALILVVGHGAVFVPQDLDYIGMSCAPSNLQPGTLRLLATDRILFGGLLAACALAVLVTVWWGIRPGERSLLGALIAIGVVGLVTAIGVHFIIGYLSLTHLLPFLVKDVAFLIGVSYLVGPLLRERGNHFHDLG